MRDLRRCLGVEDEEEHRGRWKERTREMMIAIATTTASVEISSTTSGEILGVHHFGI